MNSDVAEAILRKLSGEGNERLREKSAEEMYDETKAAERDAYYKAGVHIDRMDPRTRATLLQDALADLRAPHKFSIGDLVRVRKIIGGYSALPKPPYIVTEVDAFRVSDALRKQKRFNSQRSIFLSNMIIGVLRGDGLMEHAVDGRRFEPWVPDARPSET